MNKCGNRLKFWNKSNCLNLQYKNCERFTSMPNRKRMCLRWWKHIWREHPYALILLLIVWIANCLPWKLGWRKKKIRYIRPYWIICWDIISWIQVKKMRLQLILPSLISNVRCKIKKCFSGSLLWITVLWPTAKNWVRNIVVIICISCLPGRPSPG